MSVIQDNRQNHRDWLDQAELAADAKSGRKTGFEYAIQPDGTSLAERAWRERRERSMAYTFMSSDSDHSSLYQSSSLAQIERAITSSAPINSSGHLHSQTRNMPPPKSLYPSSEAPSSTAPFLSPTRRIRNPHNAVFGQHLPNALNSPACAHRVFGKQVAMKEEQTMCLEIMRQESKGKENIPDDHVDDLFMDLDVDRLVAERRNHQNKRIGGVNDISFVTTEPTPKGNDQSQAPRRTSSYPLSTSPPAPVFYDLCDTSNDDSTMQSSTVTKPLHGGLHPLPGDDGGFQQQASHDVFRASTNASQSLEANNRGYQFDGSNTSQSRGGQHAVRLQQSLDTQHSHGHPNPYSQPHDPPASISLDLSSSFDGSYEYPRQPPLKNPYSRHGGNTPSDASNLFGGNGDAFRQQVSTKTPAEDFRNQSLTHPSDLRLDNGHSDDQSAEFDSYQSNAFASSDQPFRSAITSFGSTHGANVDMNAPLCPTHNQPCRLLTARSEANAGRQFYKCSVADQGACDFFQWADGNEGNWNDNGTNNYAPPGGDVLDHHVENRRKFGHSSFRPGQKEVIENALQGRDVFVLMPTGGGKSLCYQLPAWCCPGLSVVISPLLSLIQDQVQSMTKLGVQSVFLNSAQDYETEQRDIQRRLFATSAHGGVKLLYITPEKLRHSGLIKTVLKKLHERNHISRFVVDEAHCLR
jgi:hypothetical protein